jgi:predicted aconitase with swiveling domain
VIALVGIMAKIPTIDQFEKNLLELVHTGDYVKVDADNGTIEIVKK